MSHRTKFQKKIHVDITIASLVHTEIALWTITQAEKLNKKRKEKTNECY